MVQKKLTLTLVAHQNYNRASPEGFFTDITSTYIPLLEMFRRLEDENVPFACTIVFAPVTCALLADPSVREQYLSLLDKTIALGQHEADPSDSSSELTKTRILARQYLDDAVRARELFLDHCQGDLIAAFRPYINGGHVEAMATSATYAFLPHYADMEEVINAQIEVGIQAHREFFTYAPDGFYLPYMGYTGGLEQNLRKYGIQWTILDAAGFLFADPVPRMGLFAPARTHNSLVLFGRDASTMPDILGSEGFLHHPCYRNQKRDVVFERDREQINDFIDTQGSRLPSGFKYWANDGTLYDPARAKEQARQDAEAFFYARKARLLAAAAHGEGSTMENFSLDNVTDIRILGTKWHEGIQWLEALFRIAAQDGEVSFCRHDQLVTNTCSLEKISPYPSANAGSGYGENLLDHSNAHLLRYARKTSQRMTEIACRFPVGNILRTRMLNLAARKTLLAQSSDWPRMIQKRHHAEYAESYFIENIRAFNTIFDALGANTLDTEWLAEVEKRTPLFPWINYRVFASKKASIKNPSYSSLDP
jgi:1,4-alpha-glucan branching enzyme